MRDDLVRELVESALASSLAGERADRALASALRSRRDLTSQERARVAAWMLGVALWRGRLDALAHGDRTSWLALFLVDREHRSIDEAVRLAGGDAAKVSDLLENPPRPSGPAERLAFQRSLPLWLAHRWIAQLGEADADAVAASMNVPGPVTLRANTLRSTCDALAVRLAQEGVLSRASTLSPTALVLASRPNIHGLEAWREGLFEVQDEGSQIVADALGARPGELIIDLCAGSGGKTLALAAAMRNDGRLLAIETEAARLLDLRVRSLRAGVTCVESRNGDARDPRFLADLHERADRVLVDAPCSALGVLRRSPDARWRLRESELPVHATLQRELLASGARLVRPGGRLVYATCSIDREENEDVAASFAVPGFTSIGTRTLRPDRDGTDGFFLATFQRHGA